MEEPELRIHKYGEEILARKSERVGKVDASIRQLVQEMKAKMIEENGIGLAAPQVGKSIQLVIVDPSGGEDPEAFLPLINPEIIDGSGSEVGEEGCLSLPGILLQIKRFTKIKLKATDLDGNESVREYDDFKARIIQHELDHLDGTLIIDRVSTLKRQLVKKEIKKLKANDEW